jgi:hypothetical protein
MLKKTILLAATMFGLIACGGDEEAATDGDKGDKGDKAGEKGGEKAKGADGAEGATPE